MAKRKKVTKARKLFLEAEKLWKEIAFKRDGRICQVQLNYPHIKIAHSQVLQIDHTFSRADKNLFFNPKNSLVVCSSCNRAKCYKQKSIDRAIDQIVRDREGADVWNYMLKINQSMKPNDGWGKVWWLERVVKELKEYLDSLPERI